ncbi:TRAP transporter substrate-binding protein DctP [Marinobacterium sedimentorum]|uniref:TRAP transporter substrate-binding protein DctP n=1 Tax=Marinobacterium sedimentorum TaxID=2927804 RepID=UPI0020C5F327|nr:TRAP transporter substrate-binding protein DctP [Marinobacterium sedimentorum]MCP8689715.1 TRAP transporter substrate-binding protein DctP [Marinobacterium sedimentorum]
MKNNFKKALCGGLLVCVPWLAQAQEITLKAVTAFGQDTYFNQRFKQFVHSVNEQGKGLVQIQVMGGPESMPPFEIGNAVRAGIVDIANSTGVFHANMVPESLAMTLTRKPMSELRANGGYELMDQIHRDKANMVWLARLSDGLQYHIYTNKKVESADLSGFKLRGVPVYRSFFQALGATPLQVAPGEVFTALERGVVDGYGWPSVGIFDLGWQEKTRYRVEPGFYNVEVSLFMNQNTWEKLDQPQREFMRQQVAWIESLNEAAGADAEADKRQQASVGIEAIVLPPEQADRFQALSQSAGWQAVEELSPQYAQQLKSSFGS